MKRDPRLIEDAAAIRRAIGPHRTLASLRADPEWPALRRRLECVLGAVHRTSAPLAPAPPRDADVVRAVHWNIEHGNWYDQVEDALLRRDELAGADLLLFNEIDLGMARAGNRDVTADLAAALNLHGVFAPLFVETTLGRDDDLLTVDGRENQESLFGIAILSRWPIGEARIVELPGPEDYQFEFERMIGRHVGLICVIERPGAPFVAVSAHLEVHRRRAHRAEQVRTVLEGIAGERRPVILAGDFNTHTFERGRPWDPLAGGLTLMCAPGPVLERRLRWPDRGRAREPLFEELARHGFEWERYVDRAPTLQLRFDRIDELRAAPHFVRAAAHRALRWAERRGRLRLDWFAGRGWSGGRGHTVHGLDGPGRASDHAPIVAEFRSGGADPRA